MFTQKSHFPSFQKQTLPWFRWKVILQYQSRPPKGVFENVSNFWEKIMMTKSAKFWRLPNLICTSEGEVCESLENAKRSPLGKSPSGEEKTKIPCFHSAPTLAKSFESLQTKGFDSSHSTNNWLSSHRNLSAISLCIVSQYRLDVVRMKYSILV